jgi:hypothetical protein
LLTSSAPDWIQIDTSAENLDLHEAPDTDTLCSTWFHGWQTIFAILSHPANRSRMSCLVLILPCHPTGFYWNEKRRRN